MILSCNLVMRHKHVLSFLFISAPTSLLVLNRISMCFHVLYVFSQQINISRDKKVVFPIQFLSLLILLTFLTVHSDVKLKSSGTEVYPCFRPF